MLHHSGRLAAIQKSVETALPWSELIALDARALAKNAAARDQARYALHYRWERGGLFACYHAASRVSCFLASRGRTKTKSR